MAGSLTTMEQTLEIYRKAPTYIDNYVLAAGVAQTVNAPVGATHCLLSANCNYFVNWNGNAAASVPVANVTTGDGAEVNPIGRALGGKASVGTPKSFSVISPEGGILAVAWLTI